MTHFGPFGRRAMLTLLFIITFSHRFVVSFSCIFITCIEPSTSPTQALVTGFSFSAVGYKVENVPSLEPERNSIFSSKTKNTCYPWQINIDVCDKLANISIMARKCCTKRLQCRLQLGRETVFSVGSRSVRGNQMLQLGNLHRVWHVTK